MSEHIIVLADRVKELSRTTGSGNIQLDGAATGFGSFADSYTYDDAVFYAVTDGVNYEVGSGQYILDGSEDALTRFPFKSSNSGAIVNFPDGVKEVYVTLPGKYAVFTGSGLDGFNEPDASGLAFWGSNQILNYDSNIVWDADNTRLGINTAAPAYTIDLGGDATDSTIRVSGLIVGTSGITFSGGGVQTEPFTPNALDATTGTDAVFELSGVSNQIIKFQEQNAGLFFSGPPSGCNPSGACDPDYPSFRAITTDDLPSLADLYLTQNSTAYDSNGMESGVAFWSNSGVVDYDSYFVWDKAQNFLGVNKQTPTVELDVDGDATVSGRLITGGDVIVMGTLDVQGDLTYIDSSTVTIADHQVELASVSGTATLDDTQINDAGIVIKSTDTDKKWTWMDATDAWTTEQNIDVNSVIFDDSSVISGAYHAGSGIVISNGIEINIADVFNVAGNDAVTQDIFQADTLAISGVSGVSVSVTTDGAVKTLTIDPSALIADVESSGNDNSAAILANSASGVVISGIADANVSAIAINVASILANSASGLSNQNNILANSASGVVISGIANTNSTNIALNTAAIIANTASGVADSGYLQGELDIAEAAIVVNALNIANNDADIAANSASGVAISGWANTNFTSHDGRITVNEAAITANSASGVAISGWAAYTIDASGEFLDTLIDSVSGWSKAYTDAISFDAGNGWILSDQLSNTETITNNTVTVSGVSGINTFYDAADDNMIISADSIQTDLTTINAAIVTNSASGVANSASGVTLSLANSASGVAISGWAGTVQTSLQDQITANDTDIATNSASGVAISGWMDAHNTITDAVLDTKINDVSGWAAAGGTNLTAGTGLFVDGGSYHTSGVGYFSNIRSYGISDPVSLGASANDEATNGVYIGRLAGNGTTGDMSETVSIGYNANQGSSETSGGVMIGSAAGLQASGNDDAVGVGNQALAFADECYRSIGIGYFAGKEMVESTGTIVMGVQAAQEATGIKRVLAAGSLSMYQAHSITDTVAVGTNSMYGASGCDFVVALGSDALRDAVDTDYTTAIGYSSYENASGVSNSIAIGYLAGQDTANHTYNILMGTSAGNAASGTGYSNAIGTSAGKNIGLNYNNFMGYEAGADIQTGYTFGVNLTDVVAFGTRAGAIGKSLTNLSRGVATEINETVAIGHEAGYNTNNMDNSIVIGTRAGSYDWNHTFMDANEYSINNSVVMGNHAGYKDDDDWTSDDNDHMVITDSFVVGSQAAFDVVGNVDHSIVVGSGAGARMSGSDNVFLGQGAGSGVTGDNNIIIGSGAETGVVNSVINLNDTIVSYSTDHRYTRIGDIKDLSDTATLSLMPAQTDQNVLNLLHGQSAPTVDMMVAQTGASPFSTGRNAVINKNGFLRIPSFADVSTATSAVSATTNEGVLLFAGDSILVSDGSVWYSGAMIEVP